MMMEGKMDDFYFDEGMGDFDDEVLRPRASALAPHSRVAAVVAASGGGARRPTWR